MLHRLFSVLPAVFLLPLGFACNSSSPSAPSPQSPSGTSEGSAQESTRVAAPPAEGQAVAVFAGGCFWCVESDFEPVDGVVSAVSGYTGGTSENPTYEEVGGHRSDHLEAVRIVYNPNVVGYAELVERFFHSVDPTQANGQFCDRGAQYRTAIFVADASEREVAEAAKREAAETLGENIVTEIHGAGRFWDAEDYHQDYYRENPIRYHTYRRGCGRDARVRELWGDAAASH